MNARQFAEANRSTPKDAPPIKPPRIVIPRAGVRFAADVDPLRQATFFDPQTSGGLLLSICPRRAEDVRQAFAAAGVPLWEIGEVREGAGIDVTA